MNSVCPAVELGDASKFAVRFDDATGMLTEIVFRGETITLPVEPSGVVPRFFDFQQDGDWIFGKSKPEFIKIEKKNDTVTSTYKFGDWKVALRYVLDVDNLAVARSAALIWNGTEPVKLKNFWMAYPTFPFKDDAGFFVPAQYPPKKFTPENFAEGAKQGSWKNSAPVVFQLDKRKSVVLLHDNLSPIADRPNSSIERRDGGIRLTQSFDVKARMKPGVSQKLGVAYLQLVDGDSETALLKIHDLMRRLGHVVPKDRPEWFESAILYSYHPGGTIGSGCKDLGGFIPATKLLDRIKELGCNSIWLMPLEDKSIYWPRDYYKFQDGLGSTPEKAGEEYKALVKRAHELGLKVLQDNVPHGGSNTNDRAKTHPEWLVQEEDGSTLSYWGFDFNWPSWIDYMAEVSKFYVKEYGIDGYRVDACGGSKIPNWNPDIPYARASHSQSQGGLSMLRAIRKAVKDQNPDGAILAEVNGGIFGAVSDATYDFDICYNVLHDARKQTPEEFVKRLRRWLHEQQYAEIPDMLRLRHVESHDSLRGQLWYGVEPHRALVALTAFIHGMPLVYHEQENGNLRDFQGIFAVRKALPELNGGDADYLVIDAPPGVFACLRTKGDDASIIVINFNEKPSSGQVRLPWNRLPKCFHEMDAVNIFEYERFDPCCDSVFKSIAEKDDCLEIDDDSDSFEWSVYALRKTDKFPVVKNEFPDGDRLFFRTKTPEPNNADWEKLTSGSSTLYIDSVTGLPVRFDRLGLQVFGEADMLLPIGWKEKAEKPTFDRNDDGIVVRRKFGNAVLQVKYSKVPEPLNIDGGRIRIESRWTGDSLPETAAMVLPVVKAADWNTSVLSGRLEDRYAPQHLTTDGVFGSIYWRQQGTSVVFDTLLTPFDAVPKHCASMDFTTEDGAVYVGFWDTVPTRVRLTDRTNDKKELSLIVSWLDNEVPRLMLNSAFTMEIGGSMPIPDSFGSLEETVGGWIYENDHYRLRIARNGTITSMNKKDGSREIVRQADIYTDYGYGKEKIRYAASNDVEAGCRIVQDGDTLRLRFEGQLRGTYRFDLMRPPVWYFTEYALDDSPVLEMSCGIKASRTPDNNRAFLGTIFPMEQVETFEYFKDGKSVVSGSNVDAKGRSAEMHGNIPDQVVLKASDGSTLLQLANLEGELSNLFLDRKNFFLTFDDRETTGMPNRWRSFYATISTNDQQIAKRRRMIEARPLDDASGSENALLGDGGFEDSSSSGDLVSLRTGAVLKGERKQHAGWQLPQGASIDVTEKRSGCASGRIDGEKEQYRLFTQDVDTKNMAVGTKLKLSARVKGAGIEKGPESWQVGCIRFAAQIDGKMHYVSSPNILGSFDWKQTAVEFTIPEKLQKLSVQVGLNGASGTLWIDDVEMVKP